MTRKQMNQLSIEQPHLFRSLVTDRFNDIKLEVEAYERRKLMGTTNEHWWTRTDLNGIMDTPTGRNIDRNPPLQEIPVLKDSPTAPGVYKPTVNMAQPNGGLCTGCRACKSIPDQKTCTNYSKAPFENRCTYLKFDAYCDKVEGPGGN